MSKPEQCPHGNWNSQDCINCQVQRDLNERNMVKALRAQVAELTKEVREWACDKCNRVYPGPPQKGFACVICPNCSGNTMPHTMLLRRRAESLAAATFERTRQRVTTRLEMLQYIVPSELDAEEAYNRNGRYISLHDALTALKNLPPEEPRNET